MKTNEELNSLEKEEKAGSEKLHELAADELAQVVAGGSLSDRYYESLSHNSSGKPGTPEPKYRYLLEETRRKTARL